MTDTLKEIEQCPRCMSKLKYNSRTSWFDCVGCNFNCDSIYDDINDKWEPSLSTLREYRDNDKVIPPVIKTDGELFVEASCECPYCGEILSFQRYADIIKGHEECPKCKKEIVVEIVHVNGDMSRSR